MPIMSVCQLKGKTIFTHTPVVVAVNMLALHGIKPATWQVLGMSWRSLVSIARIHAWLLPDS